MTRLPKKPHDLSDLRNLLGSDPTFLDVRAPGEFSQGALPGSTNLPILDDDERAAVGTAYRRQGSEAAHQLGYQLVAGERREARIAAWQSQLQLHADTRLICWRGGSRSAIAQQWLAQQGTSVERVNGGYKALRSACLHILDDAARSPDPWWVIGGKTGVAKTVAVQQLSNALDLEELANHRGSAFGAHRTPQPAQATFENHLAIAYLRHPGGSVILEDESRTIGRIGLPEAWYERMQRAGLVLIEADLETRVQHILADYVTQPIAEGRAPDDLAAHYQQALARIKRRLGGARHQSLATLMGEAFAGQRPHDDWISALLTDYYDPMYAYQLGKKQARIRFSGTHSEVVTYLRDMRA